MTHNPKQIDAATAMMLAAEYVEQKERFDFMTTNVPDSCDDVGCVLGWVGYVFGMKGCNINAVTDRLGYVDHTDFYRHLERFIGPIWTKDPALAATGLRKLAQERVQCRN